MRFLINIVTAAALALPVAATAQMAGDAPACRATLDGRQLLTTIEFADGYSIEGPWRVLDNREASLHDGSAGVMLAARLDGIVEVDPEGQRRQTSFPDPIRTTFEGHDEDELMAQAAQVWCLTVLKVKGDLPVGPPELEPKRSPRITHVTR